MNIYDWAHDVGSFQAQGKDANGDYIVPDRPGRPDYTPGYGGVGMTPELQALLDKLQMDPRGLNKFREEALRKGPSAWATLARRDQLARESDSRERGTKEVAAHTAGALDQLAARGGLSSGARERVASSGAHDYLAMSQDLARQGNLNSLQIGMNDEQNRMQQLQALPGMEIQAMQPGIQKATMWGQARQFDQSQAAAEAARKSQFEMMKYQEEMKDRYATMQANATLHGGKKG